MTDTLKALVEAHLTHVVTSALTESPRLFIGDQPEETKPSGTHSSATIHEICVSALRELDRVVPGASAFAIGVDVKPSGAICISVERK
jgi:hypothetical protein